MHLQLHSTISSRDVKGNNSKDSATTSSKAAGPTVLNTQVCMVGVVGLALAVLASRETQLQFVWRSLGALMQSRWNRLLDTYGEDEALFWVFSSSVLTLALYWTLGGIFTLLTVTNPESLRRYKVQPDSHQPIDTEKLTKALAQVLFNQLVVGTSGGYLGFLMLQWRGVTPLRELPSLGQVFAHFAFLFCFYEISFYYLHRVMHHHLLYKRFHKQHHEWTAPNALMAVYCHPVEHVVSNLTPPILGVIVLGCHVVTTWIWFTYVIVATLIDHSGYHLPFCQSPEAHDYHHYRFTQCYGVLGWMDRLHRTDTLFRNSTAYSRHLVTLSFTPVREIFPDDSDDNK